MLKNQRHKCQVYLHSILHCITQAFLVPLNRSLMEILEGKEKSLFKFLETVDWLLNGREDIWSVLESFEECLQNSISHSFESLR